MRFPLGVVFAVGLSIDSHYLAGAEDIKVIGAGLSRTGTQSLKLALGQLGFNTVHENELNNTMKLAWCDWLHDGGNFDPLLQFLGEKGYNATVDAPMTYAYLELLQHYPNAKVVFTTHPGGSKGWANSMQKLGEHIRIMQYIWSQAGADVVQKVFGSQGAYDAIKRCDRLDQDVHGCNILEHMPDNDTEKYARLASCEAGYTRRMNEVLKAVPPAQLLVFSPDQGWGPLCDFLGVPVPDVPFPRKDGILQLPKDHDGNSSVVTSGEAPKKASSSPANLLRIRRDRRAGDGDARVMNVLDSQM